MADIIPFRKPGEKCANCIHYVPKEEQSVLIIDGPPNQYCQHPDRLKGYYLTEEIISEFHLHRSPDQWCHKYKNASSCRMIHPKHKTITSIGYEMVYVKNGTFMMGTPEYVEGKVTYAPKEKRHSVTLTKGFYLGVTVVNQAQWLQVIGSKSWPYNDEMFKEGDDYPVTWISWKDCQKFINKINKIEGTNTVRLPTEAEWEYSCRAGSETGFFFGDEEKLLDEYGWYMKNTWDIGEQYPHKVAQKKPNDWGLYDTHGNVLEWCQDWKGPYPDAHVIDPVGPISGSMKIARGGAWSIIATRCRADVRHARQPLRGFSLTGLRLAESVNA